MSPATDRSAVHVDDSALDAREARSRALVLEAMRAVSFRYPALGTSLCIEFDYFRVVLETRNRDTGDSVSIGIGDMLPTTIETFEHAVDWIYARVRDAWVHELNEALYVHGKRRRDLHRDDGKTVPAPMSQKEAAREQ
jgi:hypothetical protein